MKEYSLKFSQHSHDTPKVVAHMRSRMSLVVVGLSHISSKKGKTICLIGYTDITRLMIHVQRIEKDKLKHKGRISKQES